MKKFIAAGVIAASLIGANPVGASSASPKITIRTNAPTSTGAMLSLLRGVRNQLNSPCGAIGKVAFAYERLDDKAGANLTIYGSCHVK